MLKPTKPELEDLLVSVRRWELRDSSISLPSEPILNNLRELSSVRVNSCEQRYLLMLVLFETDVCCRVLEKSLLERNSLRPPSSDHLSSMENSMDSSTFVSLLIFYFCCNCCCCSFMCFSTTSADGERLPSITSTCTRREKKPTKCQST